MLIHKPIQLLVRKCKSLQMGPPGGERNPLHSPGRSWQPKTIGAKQNVDSSPSMDFHIRLPRKSLALLIPKAEEILTCWCRKPTSGIQKNWSADAASGSCDPYWTIRSMGSVAQNGQLKARAARATVWFHPTDFRQVRCVRCFSPSKLNQPRVETQRANAWHSQAQWSLEIDSMDTKNIVGQ